MPKILAAARDVGGANAIVPVLTHLALRRDCSVACVGYGQSETIFAREHLNAVPASAYGEVGKTSAELYDLAEHIIEHESPDAVLVGTSWGVSLDKELVAAANARDVFTMAVLDTWSYYRERFISLDDLRLRYLPRLIAVMDETARAEATAAGVPADRLVITGQPHFDEVVVQLSSESIRQAAAKWRERWSAGAECLVLFASEAIARDFPPGSLWYRGYTEREALAGLLSVRGDAALVIKLHPQNALSDVSLPDGTERVWLAQDEPALECIVAADLVVGMTSMMLLEAAFAGKPAISYQPGAVGTDQFVGNKWGITQAVYSREMLRAALAERRVPPRERLQALADGHAAERVAQNLLRVISQAA